MPRWVRAFVIVGAAVIVLLLLALLTGSEHGPGRHGAAGSSMIPTEAVGPGESAD